MFLCFLLVAGLAVSALAKEKSENREKKGDDLLLDDFGDSSPDAAPMRQWKFIADTVMGGKSTGAMEMVSHDEKKCLHMTGDVSLENNGGFIQCRTDLRQKRKLFDASEYGAVSLKVKGNGEKYAVHLRTSSTWLPWQYYEATFETNNKWQTIILPFTDFKPHSLKKALKKNKIKSIAIVAIGEAMKAEIYIDEVTMQDKESSYNKLNDQEKHVILQKGTEQAFTGKLNDHHEKGFYTCRQCGAKLYESSSKFKSSCGWPSFDDEIEGAVKRVLDVDGSRTEIVCANCGGHLGHVFLGEQLTAKNTRHCVNSISMVFVPAEKKAKTETAIFASGCFWGVEYQLKKSGGLISTTTGYTGGKVKNPTYQQVSTGKTGHAEAVRVIFDSSKVTYEDLAKLYFETHDFTQVGGQGPDIGDQYRSEIFYINDAQKAAAEKLIAQLKAKGHNVATKLTPAEKFYDAEDYHQDYYKKTGKAPYCHIYKKIF